MRRERKRRGIIDEGLLYGFLFLVAFLMVLFPVSVLFVLVSIAFFDVGSVFIFAVVALVSGAVLWPIFGPE